MIREFKDKTDAEYIMESHWRIYSKEYQYDYTFKQFISEIVTHFLENRNPVREQMWIVDEDGLRHGSIGIVDAGDRTAQLRWFLIEPERRGKGYGTALIEQAIQYCKSVQSYNRIILWTNHALTHARALYARYGFHIAETRMVNLSQQDMLEEKWMLELES
ncbi:GNAT family N-acetyltransferase [Paenibacillus sambharensis]|nr:GNAT family N-acetyltransferase [Paenibacillus sambharensis]